LLVLKVIAKIVYSQQESIKLSNNDNIVNTPFATLGTVQSTSSPGSDCKLKRRTKMNKNQNPTTLKVRKGITSNHNETALKVRKGIGNNHNETALKIRK